MSGGSPVTRIHTDGEERATDLARRIDERGLDVAVIAERFAGEDDGEAVEFVVHVRADRSAVDDLVAEGEFVTVDPV